jgi:hypothetical protein
VDTGRAIRNDNFSVFRPPVPRGVFFHGRWGFAFFDRRNKRVSRVFEDG